MSVIPILGSLAGSQIAVVIPAFNEAETVPEVIGVALQLTPDVVVASDGSTDNTAESSPPSWGNSGRTYRK